MRTRLGMAQLARFLCLLALAADLPAQVRERRSAPGAAPEREQFDRQRSTGVALLIGVGKYPPFSGFNELRYPVRDVDELAAELEKQRYFVIPLKDAEATRQTVLTATEQAGESARRSGGSLIFFFSGHGFEDRGANYLATYDAAGNHLAETGLAVSAVEEAMKRAGAARRILWLDACRNDPTKGVGNRSFTRLQAATGTRILLSTKAGSVSFEDDALQHGIFTHYLLEGLRGRAVGPDGLITFRDLTDYVIEAVEARTLPRGRPQVPYEAGEASGDFLLAKASIAPADPAAPPVTVERGRQPGQVKMNPKDGQRYVWIPPGTFRMGCSEGDAECYDNELAHDVTITKGFWMAQTVVTQGAYQRVMDSNPSYFKGDRRPVEHVPWNEAAAYCGAIGGRLPTEAEWEYAARAGSSGPRYGSLDNIAWYGGNSHGQTHDVAGKLPNAWHLFDMLGNVYQWTADWYGKRYAPEENRDPRGASSGTDRVLRGGSWLVNPRNLRVSIRYWNVPAFRKSFIGFRCVGE